MTGPWGLRVSAARRALGASYMETHRAVLGAEPAVADLRPVDWYDCCLPSDDQGKLQACVGYGSKAWFEAVIRKQCGRDAIPPGTAIDGQLLWRTALEAEGHAGLNVGLSTARAGFDAAKRLGLLPKSCIVSEVGPSLEAQVLSLQETPLVVGLLISRGWFPASVNPSNGAVDESRSTKFDIAGGHCMLMVSAIKHPVTGMWAHMYQNSWTEKYGFHGFALASFNEFSTGYMGDGPFTVSGYDAVKDRSWERFLIKDESRGTI